MSRDPNPAGPRTQRLCRPAWLHACFAAVLLFGACGGGSSGAAPDGPGGPPTSALGAVTDLRVAPGAAAGQVLLHFRAPPGVQADSYRVDASILPIDLPLEPGVLSAATIVSHTHVPGAPGAAEELRLTGLPPGRTLQFVIRAQKGGLLGPLVPSVAGRIPGTDSTTLPADVQAVSGPMTIDTDGAYVLTRDISAAGTAIKITTAHVILDLGGHTITYGTGAGTAYGVVAEWLALDSDIQVRNGRITQGTGSGSECHAVLLKGVQTSRVSYLDVEVRGANANGIVTVTTPGSSRVDHCTVACRTQAVTNRHYPGVSAIYIEDATGAMEVDHNLVTASPQWGIRVQGRTTVGPAWVHHNRVEGTKALVANSYMIGVYKPDVHVFENRLAGESRGIHIDGVDGSGTDARIFDNDIVFQDQTNDEYPDRHWAHGIKIEGAGGCHLHRNHVTGVADDQHADVYGIDIQMGEAKGIVIEGNRVSATSTSAVLQGRAVVWSEGAMSAPNDVVVRHNVFVASNTLVHRDWAGRIGGLFQKNQWIAAPSAGPDFLFEYFDTSDELLSPGHRFLDPLTSVNLRSVAQWSRPGAFASTREWTLSVRVRSGALPVGAARVSVHRPDGNLVLMADSDAQGYVAGAITSLAVTNGPVFTDSKTHTVSVLASDGRSWSGPVDVESPTALDVDLAAQSGVQDTTPPGAASDLRGLALSASRIWLRWSPASDGFAVRSYLVRLNGVDVAVADGTEVVIGGLRPDTDYAPSVRAVDAAGLIGPALDGVAVRTSAEDRRP